MRVRWRNRRDPRPALETVIDREELIARALRAQTAQDLFSALSSCLRLFVPYDAAVWRATDPATGMMTAPRTTIPTTIATTISR